MSKATKSKFTHTHAHTHTFFLFFWINLYVRRPPALSKNGSTWRPRSVRLTAPWHCVLSHTHTYSDRRVEDALFILLFPSADPPPSCSPPHKPPPLHLSCLFCKASWERSLSLWWPLWAGKGLAPSAPSRSLCLVWLHYPFSGVW